MDELELALFLNRLKAACDAAQTINEDLNKTHQSLTLLSKHKNGKITNEEYNSLSLKANAINSIEIHKRREETDNAPKFKKDFDALKLLGFNVMIPESSSLGKAVPEEDLHVCNAGKVVSDSEDDASYATPASSHSDILNTTTSVCEEISDRNDKMLSQDVDKSENDIEAENCLPEDVEQDGRDPNGRPETLDPNVITSHESFILISQSDNHPDDTDVTPTLNTMIRPGASFVSTPDSSTSRYSRHASESSPRTSRSANHSTVSVSRDQLSANHNTSRSAYNRHVSEPTQRSSASPPDSRETKSAADVSRDLLSANPSTVSESRDCSNCKSEDCCPVCEMQFHDADTLSYRNYHVQNHFSD